MGIYNNQATLGTAAEVIVSSWSNPQSVIVRNMSENANEFIYVGGSAITVSNTAHINSGEEFYLTLPPGDDLYALSDPGGVVVGILATRK